VQTILDREIKLSLVPVDIERAKKFVAEFRKPGRSRSVWVDFTIEAVGGTIIEKFASGRKLLDVPVLYAKLVNFRIYNERRKKNGKVILSGLLADVPLANFKKTYRLPALLVADTNDDDPAEIGPDTSGVMDGYRHFDLMPGVLPISVRYVKGKLLSSKLLLMDGKR
jgi:hypothetical protein